MSNYRTYAVSDLLKATAIWTTVMTLSTTAVFLPNLPAGFVRNAVQVSIPVLIWGLMKPAHAGVSLLPVLIGAAFAMIVAMILSAIKGTKKAQEDPKGKTVGSAFTYGGIVMAFAIGMFFSAYLAPRSVPMFNA